ncbi:MAG: glycoside hydrolase family 30 beta sandwich domain-containing protein [Oceanipulchritudo sp.]
MAATAAALALPALFSFGVDAGPLGGPLPGVEITRMDGTTYLQFHYDRELFPSPPWRLEQTTDLENWEEISVPAEGLDLSLVPEGSFFRLVGEGEGPETVAEVDAAIPYQVIDGFGASAAFTAQNISDELADAFFDPETGLGLSLCRIRINFRDRNWEGEWSSWELRTARKAVQRGARVWAVPWSAPGEFKEGYADPERDFVGGSVRPDAYAEYAEAFADFIEYAATEGVPLYGISTQNEPDYREHAYESCDWSAAALLEFVTAHLQPTLQERDLSHVQVIGPETMNWNRSSYDGFREPGNVDILAFHNYDWVYDFFGPGTRNRWPQPVDTDKRVWQSEISDIFSGRSFTDTIEDALDWAEYLHYCLTVTNLNAWHWWWLLPSVQSDLNQSLVIGSQDDDSHSFLKRAYAIGQFSKFIRPGYRRIHLEDALAPGLQASAYHGPDGAIVLVVINPTPASFRQGFSGLPSDALVEVWETSAAKSLEHTATTRTGLNGFHATVPAQSILTFHIDPLHD